MVDSWLSKLTTERLEELKTKLAEDIKAKIAEIEEFWASDLCAKMIQDVLACNQGIANDDFSYHEEKLRALLGWEQIPMKQIELFFSVMADPTLGVEAESTDEDNPFPNWTYRKRGLCCSVMSGQGTLITVYSDPRED